MIMNKNIFKCICVFLIVATITTRVFAASSVSVSLSANDTSVNSGDTITVTVNASVDSCGSGGIKLSFDSGIFQLISGKWLVSNTFMSDFSTTSKDGVFAFDGSKAISGSVFQFQLKVKDKAAIGNHTISATFKADSKSASNSVKVTVACSHSYDNNCDTSCNNCGLTRKISHSWNSGTYSKKPTCTANGTRVYTCKVCGTTKSESASKVNHTYDNSCDDSCNVCGSVRNITHTYEWTLDGEGHSQKCSVCGITQNNGGHTLETVLGNNEGGHGYKCSVCGLIPNAQAHSYDGDCDAICNECNYTRTVTHAYNEKAIYDADAHWFECMICGVTTEKAAHEPGEEATDSSDQLCLTCGYVMQRGGNHVHKASGTWHSNDVGHWSYCACLTSFDPEAHVLTEGIIDQENNTASYACKICKHVIVEELPEETVPEETVPEETVPESTEPTETIRAEKSFYGIPLWFIFACALCVSLIVNIIFIILMSIKKRGHYSK